MQKESNCTANQSVHMGEKWEGRREREIGYYNKKEERKMYFPETEQRGYGENEREIGDNGGS